MHYYLAIGFVSMLFFLFVEPHLFSAAYYVRYEVIGGVKVAVKVPKPSEESTVSFFMGMLAMAVLVAWPLWAVVFVARIFNLVFGRDTVVMK